MSHYCAGPWKPLPVFTVVATTTRHTDTTVTVEQHQTRSATLAAREMHRQMVQSHANYGDYDCHCNHDDGPHDAYCDEQRRLWPVVVVTHVVAPDGTILPMQPPNYLTKAT